MSDMTFPVLLRYADRVFTVEGYIGMVDEYKDGRGYVFDSKKFVESPGFKEIKQFTPMVDGVTYIYNKDPNRYDKGVKVDFPIFRIMKYADGYMIQTKTKEKIDEEFLMGSLIDLSLKRIVAETEGVENLYTEEEINQINSSSSMFIPTVEPGDDFLKKIIKQAILDKDINIRVALKNRFNEDKKYTLSNLISSLTGTTKMSVDKFIMWCELLGLDFMISVEDNGLDKVTPLRKPLVFDSRYNKILDK